MRKFNLKKDNQFLFLASLVLPSFSVFLTIILLLLNTGLKTFLPLKKASLLPVTTLKPAILLGAVVDNGPGFDSCQDNRFVFGSTCPTGDCQGPPDYTVSWSYPETNRFKSQRPSDCRDNNRQPSYTFEHVLGDTPQSDSQGKEIVVKISMDTGVLLRSYSLVITDPAGNELPGSRQTGYFVTPDPNQTFKVKVYSNNQYNLNHLWFYTNSPITPIVNCGLGLDLFFVQDDTGSMADEIQNVKTQLTSILNAVEDISGGDYRLGLMTFKDNVDLKEPLTKSNLNSIRDKINSLEASAGYFFPEASDVALRKAVNESNWRQAANKVIILNTDAPPGGLNDRVDPEDYENGRLGAREAAAKGIKIVSILSYSYEHTEETKTLMKYYANTTGGLYLLQQNTSEDMAEKILALLRICRPPPATPTPTPPPATPTPTLVPNLSSCTNFSLGGGKDENNDRVFEYFPSQINMGIYFKTNNTAGLREYRFRKADNNWNFSEYKRSQSLNDGWFPFTAPKDTGYYHVDINLFPPSCSSKTCNNFSCQQLCTSDSKVYRVSGCNYNLSELNPANLIGTCNNRCNSGFWIKAPPTPTITPSPTPTITPIPTPTPQGLTCRFVAKWGSQGSRPGQFYEPDGLALSTENNRTYLYVTDLYGIDKFDTQGNFIMTLGQDQRISQPAGIAIDPTNRYLYVVDKFGGKVFVYSVLGAFQRKFGQNGWRNGEYDEPDGIMVSQSGVYVADANNNRLQKVSPYGNFIANYEFPGNNFPHGLSLYQTSINNDDDFYVTDAGSHSIKRFKFKHDQTSFSLTKSFGSQGNGNLQFASPKGVAVDKLSGLVFVADRNNDRIQVIGPDGSFYGKWGSYGDQDFQFKYPSGIAVNSQGDVFVADTYNNRIQKLSCTY